MTKKVKLTSFVEALKYEMGFNPLGTPQEKLIISALHRAMNLGDEKLVMGKTDYDFFAKISAPIFAYEPDQPHGETEYVFDIQATEADLKAQFERDHERFCIGAVSERFLATTRELLNDEAEAERMYRVFWVGVVALAEILDGLQELRKTDKTSEQMHSKHLREIINEYVGQTQQEALEAALDQIFSAAMEDAAAEHPPESPLHKSKLH